MAHTEVHVRGAHAEVTAPGFKDDVAVEEPLEIRVDGRALAVTMRTPGHDVELAHGFLLTEGVIGSPSDVLAARYCDSRDDGGRNTYNVLDLALAAGVEPPDPSLERNFYTTSSCGVCGKASLDAVRLTTRFPPAADTVTVTLATLATLPDSLRAARSCSTPPEACTPPACSPPAVSCSSPARTSAATTPSTRSSVGRCSTVGSLLRARR